MASSRSPLELNKPYAQEKEKQQISQKCVVRLDRYPQLGSVVLKYQITCIQVRKQIH